MVAYTGGKRQRVSREVNKEWAGGRGVDAYLAPAGRSPALGVLEEQMCDADLARLGALGGGEGAAVELGHIDLELLGVGALWGLPPRVLLGGVEVVGQVLAVAVADFPAGGEAGLWLLGRG